MTNDSITEIVRSLWLRHSTVDSLVDAIHAEKEFDDLTRPQWNHLVRECAYFLTARERKAARDATLREIASLRASLKQRTVALQSATHQSLLPRFPQRDTAPPEHHARSSRPARRS